MARRQLIPAAGRVCTVLAAAYAVVQLDAQPATPVDFTGAATAEVRDAAGQVLLQGLFGAEVEDVEEETERHARLTPIGAVPNAAGEAEVEFDRETTSAQEIEFSVKGLAPGTALTFVIDGNRGGEGDVEHARQGRGRIRGPASVGRRERRRAPDVTGARSPSTGRVRRRAPVNGEPKPAYAGGAGAAQNAGRDAIAGMALRNS